MLILWSLAAALGLAAVHLFSEKLRVLDGVPRNRFLSAAGGIAVAYVFLQLVPALVRGHEILERAAQDSFLSFLRDPIWLVVLLSLALFYGADQLAWRSKARAQSEGNCTSAPIFWLHLGVFAAVNALVGYLLLHNQQRSLQALGLFFVAMVLKFIINDHNLHEKHMHRYDRLGRWILAGAVLGGWSLRALWELSEWVPTVLQAILVGAVLLNVLKEELPAQNESRYWTFLAGVVGYAALLQSFSG